MISLLNEYNVRMFTDENNLDWFSVKDIEALLEMTDLTRKIGKQEKDRKLPYYGINKDEYKIFKNSMIKKNSNKNFDKIHNTGEKFIRHTAVYKIAFRSNKEEAMQFTDWVARVIDEIRKDGYYIASENEKNQFFKARKEGKEARREETDQIKLFTEYVINQNSKIKKNFYSYFSLMVNEKCGLPPKNGRDNATKEQLKEVAYYEKRISKLLKRLMNKGKDYKEILEIIKEEIREE